MIRMTFIAIAVMCVLLAIIPQLLWLLAFLIGLCFGAHVPYAPFGWSALGLVAVFALVMLYGIYVGRFRLHVQEETFLSPEVPAAFDGYTIVHISDLHLSTFDDCPSALQRVVDSINAQQPDLICFTGDLVSMGASEAVPYAELLGGLQAKDGVCSVLGNHDFLIYRRDFQSDADRLAEVDHLARYESDTLGWHLLRNESLTLHRGADAISIVGVDNTSCTGQGFRTIYAGDLPKALADSHGMRILLSHDPSHWRAEVVGKQNIALTLSGHTHAGQVRLFGWPLSSVSFRDNAGWYTEGLQSLYINTGIGCTLPMRLNCPQEITVIRLRKQ